MYTIHGWTQWVCMIHDPRARLLLGISPENKGNETMDANTYHSESRTPAAGWGPDGPPSPPFAVASGLECGLEVIVCRRGGCPGWQDSEIASSVSCSRPMVIARNEGWTPSQDVAGALDVSKVERKR